MGDVHIDAPPNPSLFVSFRRTKQQQG